MWLKAPGILKFSQGLNPGTFRVSTENSKAAVIFAICAGFEAATAEFRFNSFITANRFFSVYSYLSICISGKTCDLLVYSFLSSPDRGCGVFTQEVNNSTPQTQLLSLIQK